MVNAAHDVCANAEDAAAIAPSHAHAKAQTFAKPDFRKYSPKICSEKPQSQEDCICLFMTIQIFDHAKCTKAECTGH